MNIPDLVKFMKKLQSDINTKRVKYEEKHMPKIEAYVKMIIERGEIIQKETQRMQTYMDNIGDGIKKLQERGVVIQIEEKKNENTVKT